jgi:hypothetical protein
VSNIKITGLIPENYSSYEFPYKFEVKRVVISEYNSDGKKNREAIYKGEEVESNLVKDQNFSK